ncbi:unnamed protein product, partial [Mesorhabditis belari]|uniref:Uncharacterized protein n=1 Tax=Mesorhabditis belari TaxID=2138241 RepID=A0AAF3FDS4_9BILA
MRLSICRYSAEVVASSSTIVPTHRRAVRELRVVKNLYAKGDVASLKTMHTIMKQQKDADELASRAAAYTVALGLKLNRLKEAEKFLPKTKYCPTVIRRSLQIMFEIKQGRVDYAIDLLEDVLNEEEEVYMSENQCISEQALDALYQAINSKENTADQMKRFRNLQRILTACNRRTNRSIDELLESQIEVPMIFKEPHREIPLSNKILEQIPHFLSAEDREVKS